MSPPSPNPPIRHVAVVVPIYNEAGVIERTHAQICAVIKSLPYSFTIYYVDDGSNDATAQSLEKIAAGGQPVVVLELSRNFGHQAALTAGLDRAEGDVVITMDGDGQHPPELIGAMLDLIAQGYDVVQTQRVEEDTSFKHWTSAAFYSIINRISGTHVSPAAADYRAMSRTAVEALKVMPEYHRFLRGMIAWMGFRTVILPYRPLERLGGTSKYSLNKMFKLAMDAVFSFSLVPLYVGLSLGALMLALAFLEMIYVLSFWVRGAQSSLAPGWSSLMFVILIVSGFIMILLGFVGMYVGYIFQEVKRRPVYIVRKEYRQPPSPASPSRPGNPSGAHHEEG
jgi:glycosyltransferase involved in cell wall biosynthesis